MNILIVGAGEIGRYLALKLSREGQDITVIESDPGLAGELDSLVDARVICGNGTSVNTLVDAGVAECGLFLALTSDNNVNLVSSQIASSSGARKVVCRVHPDIQREEWIFNHRESFGVDHIFSSERLTAIELSKFIRNPDSLSVEEIARGRIEMQQVEVAAGSAADGMTLGELKPPPRLRIAMVSRGDEHLVPTAEESLQPGDVLTMFGESRKIQDLAKMFGTDMGPDEVKRVVIFGGGEYAVALASTLSGSKAYKVRIFEEDPERCEELTHLLHGVCIIQADATRLNELKEEQVGEADWFVATSQSDEDNVMSCLQAHSIGAKNCLTIIHRADYADAISNSASHFGILAAVSPREATRRELSRFITSDRYHKVADLGGGEVIEAAIGAGSRLVDQKVSDIDWPSGCVLVAHLHGIHAQVPAADDVLKQGDFLFAMVTGKAKKGFLKLVGK